MRPSCSFANFLLHTAQIHFNVNKKQTGERRKLQEDRATLLRVPLKAEENKKKKSGEHELICVIQNLTLNK